MPVNDSDVLLLSGPPLPVEELARQWDVQPLRRGQDMRADLWDSDEEFGGFLVTCASHARPDLD